VRCDARGGKVGAVETQEGLKMWGGSAKVIR
jgi:hypothetical protein